MDKEAYTKMKFFLYANDQIFGWVNLAVADRSMGVAMGELQPAPEYQRIRSLWRERMLHDNFLGPYNREKLVEIEDKINLLNIYIKPEGSDTKLEFVGISITDLTEEMATYNFEKGEFPLQIDVFGIPWWHMEEFVDK